MRIFSRNLGSALMRCEVVRERNWVLFIKGTFPLCIMGILERLPTLLVLVCSFFLSGVLIRFLSLLQICTRCPGGVHNLSRVAAYCEETSKLMQARCCLNQKGTILG